MPFPRRLSAAFRAKLPAHALSALVAALSSERQRILSLLSLGGVSSASHVAILATRIAMPIRSARRFSPLGPVAIIEHPPEMLFAFQVHNRDFNSARPGVACPGPSNPSDRCRNPDAEPGRRLSCRKAVRRSLQHTHAKIVTQSSRHQSPPLKGRLKQPGTRSSLQNRSNVQRKRSSGRERCLLPGRLVVEQPRWSEFAHASHSATRETRFKPALHP